MALKIYGPDQVSIVFNGIVISSGLADGTFVKIEQDEDTFSMVVGTDGEATRSKSNNRGHTISFFLMQTADANDLLSAMHTLDLTSAGGAGVGPLAVKDGSGRAIYLAEKAWIQKPPAVEFGREAASREWTLRTNNLVRTDAGN